MLFHPTDRTDGLTTDWEEAMTLVEWHHSAEDAALVEAYAEWDDYCEQLENYG